MFHSVNAYICAGTGAGMGAIPGPARAAGRLALDFKLTLSRENSKNNNRPCREAESTAV
jgi:hypothetical protein